MKLCRESNENAADREGSRGRAKKQGFPTPPLRVDAANAQAWQGKQLLTLRPRAFAVLRYLSEHSGQLVTKDEVIRAVWLDTVVTDDALVACVLELRKALQDEVQRPRYIETVQRRGYRFIGPVVSSQEEEKQKLKGKAQKAKIEDQAPAPSPQHPIPSLVGRETELTQLHGWFENALRGERQLIFVTGESGIGKTTLVKAFLQALDPRRSTLDTQPRIGQGQCIEQYGVGEAYLPVLEALGRLCRGPDGERLITLLQHHAPTWLVQMPALLNSTAYEALQRKTQGATRERMLREIVEALEAITAERPLVLTLEDLHWSDPSTLDLLSMVARRSEPARLLIIGTYRPLAVMVRQHPLRIVKQELQLHHYCQELALEPLSEAQVAEYLAMRFEVGAHGRAPLRFAQFIAQRTEGNPLFLVSVVDDLIARGMFVQTNTAWELKEEAVTIESRIPDSIRQLVALQSERLLPEERQTLEAASIAGMEFSAAAVAAALATNTTAAERHCEYLAERRQFLRRLGIEEWPDGTLAARYGFLHALYQQLWHERVSPTQLQHYHLQIGERKERAYGERVREIAVELAVHFEQGGGYWKAIHYLQQAGENAIRRSAYQEATSHLTKGLELLKTCPDTSERTQQELTLQLALGVDLTALKGYGAPTVEHAYNRALELCRQMEETPQLFSVLRGLQMFYTARAEHPKAHTLVEQLLGLAQRQHDPVLLVGAHFALGQTLIFSGDFVLTLAHLEQGLALYDPQQHQYQAWAGGHLGVQCLGYAAWALWFLGYPDQALKKSQEALTLAEEMSHSVSLAAASFVAVVLHHCRREWQIVQERTEVLITLSTEHGFAFRIAQGTIYRGSALVEQGQVEKGSAQIRQGMAAYQATGAELWRSYWLALLAEAHGKAGQGEEGLTALAEALALVNNTGERMYEAELYRLKGTLTLQSKTSLRPVSGKSQTSQNRSEDTSPQPPTPSTQAEAEAEACFLKAIEVARHQQAKSLELRAAMSLARLWQSQGKRNEARQVLAKIYGWFTEGFNTKDLQEARSLLEELGR